MFRLYFTFIFFLFFCELPSIQSSEKTNHASFPYPIDIVYLWVDGSDPNWLSIKNLYQALHQQKPVFLGDACTDNRFFDHQELKYSLRSLIKFAPFFNHIYIVTMNQKPLWIKDHEKISFINHEDIFPNLSDLPTFNSQAIECHLHRIQGLCEHFIYFNDDVLLGKSVSPYDFFSQDGKIRVLFERGYTVSSSPEVQASLYRKAWINSNALLDSYFTAEQRHRLCHAPFALRKSLIEEAEQMFPSVFITNSSHKFRSEQDFNITNGLLQYIWLYLNYAEKGTLTNKMISIYADYRLEKTIKELESFIAKPLDTFCLQDCVSESRTETSKILKVFLERLFPDPAPWEEVEEAVLKRAI